MSYICEDCGKEENGIPTIVKGETGDKTVCGECLQNYVVCEICGNFVPKDSLSGIMLANGKNICEECFQEEMVKCEDCGEYVEKTNTRTTLFDGKLKTICEDCIRDNYVICEDCGEFVSEENATCLPSGDWVCSSCIDANYATCDCCGDLVRVEDTYETQENETICSDCREQYYYCCERCGDLVHQDNVEEVDGDYFCPDCADRIRGERGEDVIKCYHDCSTSEAFQPMYTVDDEIKGRTKETFGFELEVSGDRSLARDYVELFEHNEVILMNDSSIVNGGFEIISRPMTRDYFETVFKPVFFKSLKFLRDNGFKGHNRGGLHFHIDHRLLDMKQKAQLVKILYGKDSDRKTWLAITQRKRENMECWSRMDVPTPSFRMICEGTTHDYERHSALRHDDRTGTYEIRIFNSNIRDDRFMKNLECVYALVDYTNAHKIANRAVCNTKGFLKYVKKNSLFYPNLFAFIEERKILENYGLDISEEVLTLV